MKNKTSKVSKKKDTNNTVFSLNFSREKLNFFPIKQDKSYSTLRKWLLKSQPYKKWLRGKPETITYSDICYMIEGTRDSSISLLRKDFRILWGILFRGQIIKDNHIDITNDGTTIELLKCLNYIYTNMGDQEKDFNEIL